MKEAIIRLNPFISKQKIYIYEDSTHIDTTETKIGEIAESVMEICDKYNLDKIILSGSKSYSAGIKNIISNKYIAKYNKEITIELS